jgi:hypothetical protein
VADFWDALGAISDAVAATVVIVASIYAYLQLRETKSSRHLTSLLSFQEKYHSAAMRSFRTDLLKGRWGPPEEFDADRLGEAEFHQFWQLMDQLEVLGVLVDRKLVDFQLVAACFHRSPPMVWAAVEPYILARRTEASPLEAIYFERLVQRYRASPSLPSSYWARIDVI